MFAFFNAPMSFEKKWSNKEKFVKSQQSLAKYLSLNQQIHEILFSYLVELVFNAIFEALEICGLSAKVPIGMVEK